MDNKTNVSKIVFWVVAILLLCLFIAAPALKRNQQSTAQNNIDITRSNNLTLQNECIKNAQSTAMSNPAYYNTQPIGAESQGWTLAGQEYLQSKTQACQQQYPTN